MFHHPADLLNKECIFHCFTKMIEGLCWVGHSSQGLSTYHHDVAQKCTRDSPAGHGTSPNQSDKPDATRATCPTCNNVRQHTSTSLVFMYMLSFAHLPVFGLHRKFCAKKSPKRNVKSGESWAFPLGPDCLQIFCCQSAFSCLRKPWNHIGTIHVRMQHPWVKGHRITQ